MALKRFGILTLALFASATTPVAADEREIRAALLGLKTAVETIDSLTCKVAISGTDGSGSYNTGGVYRRAGEREYFALGPANAPDMVLVRDGPVVTSFSASARFAWIKSGESWRYEYDPWSATFHRYAQMMMLKAFDKNPRGPLTGLSGGSVRDIGGTNRAGVRVSYSSIKVQGQPQMTESFDLDAGYNYAIARFDRTMSQPNGRKFSITSTLSEFKEVAPGVYLPGQIVRETVGGNGPNQKLTVKLTDLVVNRGVAPGDLVVRFPKGTLVSDHIKQVEYKVDAAGNPDGPVRPLIKPNLPTNPAKK